MMTLLLILFLVFSVVIFYLCHQFGREQKLFREKINMLQKSIVESQQKSLLQSNKIQLSDDLEKSLQASKTILSDAIVKLNYDLLELLSKNKLLK